MSSKQHGDSGLALKLFGLDLNLFVLECSQISGHSGLWDVR